MSCPKCQSRKDVLCLAGGIVLTQTQQMPLYCTSCKLNFIAKKKEQHPTETQDVSFEVLAINQESLLTQPSKDWSLNLIRVKRQRLKY